MKKIKFYIIAFMLFVPLISFAKTKQQIEQRWEKSDKDWANTIKMNYKYKGFWFFKKLNTESIFVWNPYKGNWSESQRDVYSYEKKKVKSVVSYLYYGPSGEWKYANLTDYKYSKDSTIELMYKYDDSYVKDYDWMLYKKTINYFKGGKKVSSKVFFWDNGSHLWQMTEIHSFTYNGKMLEKESVNLFYQGKNSETIESTFKYGKRNRLDTKDVDIEHHHNDSTDTEHEHAINFNYKYSY